MKRYYPDLLLAAAWIIGALLMLHCVLASAGVAG